MARKEISVEPRVVTGKKVATLRRAGILPGNLYGHGVDSVTLQLKTEDLQHTVRAIAANEVIDLKIAGERVALDSSFLHADFYQVSLREKMRGEVPLVITGTSSAVETYNGVLMTPIEIIHIEALPLDFPATIEVDISGLNELEATIHVRDLIVPANVTVLSDPDIAVVKVASPRVSVEGEEPAAALTERTVPVEVNGKRFSVRLWLPDMPSAGGGGAARRTPRPRPAASGSSGGAGDGVISAPMQGTIVKVLVTEGDEVEAGQALLVLEAMKMENHINALGAGTVKEIRVGPGDTVGPGDVLLVIG